MKRIMWVVCCAVIAQMLVPLSALSQQAEDPFGPGQSSAPQANRSAPETSLIAATGQAAAESATDFCQCLGESKSSAVAKIEQALSKPLNSDGLEFGDTPLEEVVSTLEQGYGIPVEVDTPALEEIGIDAQEPVNASLHGISLSAALRLMLRQLQLTYVIENEVLMITTPEEAERQLDVCVYDVRGIAKNADDQSIKQLIDTIVSCVHTDTWAVNGGGKAEIRPLNSGLIVISQTRAVHEQVHALLSTIRDMRQVVAGKSDAAGKSAATIPESERVVTRAYMLQLSGAKSEAVEQQIRRLITSSLPDERWQGQLDDGQHVLLTILPDRIVLRHTQEIQNEVETLLTDSGVATAAPRIASEPAGRSGYEGGMYSGGYGSGYGRGGYGFRSGRGGYGFTPGQEGSYGGFGGEEVPQPMPTSE
jgi:hypothetical protein